MKFLEAVLILSGMIIGAGMFGIPYAFSRAGFWLGVFELILLAALVTGAHLAYGEVVLRTNTFHRMPGYARIYLGKIPAALAWLSAIFGILGALLAYLILSGVFLHTAFAPFWAGSRELFWAAATAALGALITVWPLRKEALVNGILTALLIVFVIILSLRLEPFAQAPNLAGFRPENFFVPYGVLLFALTGGTVIPDLITFLGRNKKRARRAIVIGTLIPAALYFFFALAVVGAAGERVSEDALSGLRPFLGEAAVRTGSIIGFLAVFTSYIVLSGSFRQLLRLDAGNKKRRAWLVASLAPFLLYVLGFQSFIVVIAAVGTVAVGADILLTLAMYFHLRSNPA